MREVARALYNQPVLFLGAVQIAITSLAAAHVLGGWIPVVSLAVVTWLQRSLVTPDKRRS